MINEFLIFLTIPKIAWIFYLKAFCFLIYYSPIYVNLIILSCLNTCMKAETDIKYIRQLYTYYLCSYLQLGSQLCIFTSTVLRWHRRPWPHMVLELRNQFNIYPRDYLSVWNRPQPSSQHGPRIRIVYTPFFFY